MEIKHAGAGKRIGWIREKLAESGLDAALLTSRENSRYYSGFSGTESHIVISPGTAAILVDFRYLEQVAGECPGFKIVDSTHDKMETLVQFLKNMGCRRLGVEEDDLSLGLSGKLTALKPGLSLEPAGTWLNSLRSIKDDEEISLMKTATSIAEKAFLDILPSIHAGQAETEIAARLEYAMRMQGASGASFATIVASGARGAMPHGVASAKQVRSGESIVMDFGCVWKGYCSDMTRTIFLGEPDPAASNLYGIVLDAQLKSQSAVRAGMTGIEADRTARDIIGRAGYGRFFDHGLGHGVGLAIHEAPRLSRTSADTLAAGQVVTVEPGIYLPGRFGVRIEDAVVVLEGGSIDLNSSTKDMIILDG
jgi:Xaa-Pro aminopeptidase